MKQRASQPSPSRKYRWRETPSGRYWLTRYRIVRDAWFEFQAIERASREKLMRDMPPYEPSLVTAGTQVQFIREGGSEMAHSVRLGND